MRIDRNTRLLVALALLSGCSRTELPLGALSGAAAGCPGLSVAPLRIGSGAKEGGSVGTIEISKLDILFVIDNSISMADKQELLRDAVPLLARRLVNPLCISAGDPPIELELPVEQACPEGFTREFVPIDDIHMGIITSSLGGHGGEFCSQGHHRFNPTQNDQAHLLGSVRRVDSYAGLGFLAWDPEQRKSPPGEFELERFVDVFQEHVTATGESGCGFESQLEAWYRFLIDPEPPAEIVLEADQAEARGVDSVLLEQRKAFLRPDSTLAIVILTDENDCSVVDDGFGWLITTAVVESGAGAQRFTMPRATSICATSPNDRCCRSCATRETQTPSGCLPLAEDPECRPSTLDGTDDNLNLRCWDQKRRFGIDLLYPTARYSVGLKESTLCPASRYRDGDCNCRAAFERATKLGAPPPACTAEETGPPLQNPLFSGTTGAERDRGQIYLTGIVGVPWQDVATRESLADPERLEYLSGSELSELDPDFGYTRWDLMLGDLDTNSLPRDPFMRESIDPRTSAHPLTGDMLPGPNSVNRHERPIPERDDLQYACVFPLQTPRDCRDTTTGCDCLPDDDSRFSNPLCQAPDPNAPPDSESTTQYFAKAYPGLRHLDVLRRHGQNAVTASICPKFPQSVAAPSLGYQPALSELVERLRCSSLQIDVAVDASSEGRVQCALVAVSSESPCSCEGARSLPSEAVGTAIRNQLAARGLCRDAACSDRCLCEIVQLAGSALSVCQNEPGEAPLDPATSSPIDGWCYVHPSRGFGSAALADCPGGDFSTVRLLGGAKTRPGETLYAACGEPCQP